MNWTLEDTQACYRQGFGIFTCDHGDCLMKLDDPTDANQIGDDDDTPYVGPVFDTDIQAAAYVQKNADEGNIVCRKAIEFLIEQKSPDVEEFNLVINW